MSSEVNCIEWKRFSADMREGMFSKNQDSVRVAASAIGLTHSAVHRAMTGKRMSASHFLLICDAYDMYPFDYLM